MVPTKKLLLEENLALKRRLAQAEASLGELSARMKASPEMVVRPASTKASAIRPQVKKGLEQNDDSLDVNMAVHQQDEQTLLEREESFKAIIEAFPIAVGISKTDGSYLYINHAFEQLFGYPLNEVKHLNASDLYWNPDDRIAWLNIFQENGVLRDYEVQLKRKDGTPFWALISVAPMDYGGWPALVGTVLDISERKRLEATQRESDDMYSAVFDRSPFALALARMPEGNLVEVNNAFLSLFGFTREEVIGKTSQELEITPAEARAQVDAELQKHAHVQDFEVTSKTKSGKPLVLSLNLDWVILGSVKFLLTSIIDITARKHAEQVLADLNIQVEVERNRLTAVMEALPVGVAILDAKGGNVRGNHAFEQIWGSPRPAIVGVSDYSTLKASWVDSNQPVRPDEWASAQAVQKGLSVTGQMMKIQRFDGSFAYIHNSGAPIFGKNGQITGCVVAIQDISELKNREDEVRQLNRTLKAVSNSNQAMMRAVDETAFLNAVCRIIVEDCGFAMVWIGYADHNKQKSVRPVASAGFEQGYLENLNITWADTERGQGPTGTAIRTRRPARCNNMLTDLRFAPWRQAALKRGYASSIVLPLISGERAFGALNIYSREPNGFSDAEEQLLIGLAGDLAYGINTLRLKADHARNEEALRQNEERYRTLFNNMSEGFALHEIVCDKAGKPCDYRFLELNPSFERMTGLKREGTVGKLASHVPPGLEPSLLQAYGEVALTGNPVQFDNFLEARSRYFRVYAYRPAPGQFAVIYMDITERKQAEEAVQQSEAMLRAVLDQMPSGVTVRDALTGELLLANNQARAIMGILADNSSKFSFYSGKHPDGRPYAPEEWPITRSIASGEVVSTEELEYERSDGSRVALSISSTPIRDSHGKIITGVGVFQDITERKRVQDRLAYLASFPERNPNPIVEVDLNGQIQYANPAAQNLFPDMKEQGTDHEWLTDWDIVIRSYRQGHEGMIVRDVSVGDRTYQQTISYIAPGDLVRIYGLDITTRKLAEQSLIQARDELEKRVQERTQELNTANNQLRLEVIERQQTAEELHASVQELQVIEEELRNNNELLIEAQRVQEVERQRYQDLFEFAPDGYLVTDNNGLILEANLLMAELLKISRSSLIGKPLLVFIAQSDHDTFLNQLAELRQKREIQSLELRIKPRNGKEVTVAVTIASVKDRTDKDILRWMIRDITERKKTEAIIRQNYLRNTVLAEVSQSLTEASLDEKAILEIVAQTTARLIGDCCVIALASEDGQWLNPVAWYHNDSEALSLITELYTNARHSVNEDLAGQVFHTSQPVLLPTVDPPDQTDDGSSIYRIFYQKVGISSLLIVPLQIGAKTIGTFGLTRGFGGQPFTHEDQNLLEILANRTAQSIHNARLYQELQNAMRKELEVHDQLVQAEKFAVVGRLLASITHEINNPLQTVKNCLYLLQADTTPNTQAADALNMAVTETNRLSNLVAQLREAYRPPTKGQSQVLSLPDMIGEVHTLLSSYLEEKHALWVYSPPPNELTSLVNVEAIPDQLKQVFLNICLNAIDAMEPDGGSIMINIKLSDDASQVGVCIRDTGPGLSPDVKARLFEPFLTTKEKGLGLGLVICYDIILRHSGHIEVESEPGEGAAFTIWLPLLKEDR